MEDSAIVDLYWQRSDRAIAETDRKYGRYCHTIAYNICLAQEDAEECVSDTWFRAWNLMPDKRPAALPGLAEPENVTEIILSGHYAVGEGFEPFITHLR